MENGEIKILKQGITETPCDVMVNSANPWLGGIGRDLTQMCGGVDGAIHRAAGIGLLDECETLPTFEATFEGEKTEWRCDHGDFRMTSGYRLPCKRVFHAVAPIYQDGNAGELQCLSGLYHKIFSAFLGLKYPKIALPPMGTRSYGMPKSESSYIALANALNFTRGHLIEICFCVIDEQEHQIYMENLRALLEHRRNDGLDSLILIP
jgi:O-acetyl-ADP-ribose deacetylase (regulator of RNase III)